MRRLCFATVVLLIVLAAAVPALAAADPGAVVQRAQELFTARQFAQAEAMARQAIGTPGARAAILTGSCNVVILCKLSQGDFDGAKQAAQDLKGRITDATVQGYLDAQVTAIEAKRAAYEKAVADLEATVSAHPKDEQGASAAYKVGLLKAFWGRTAEAQAAFQRVISDFRSSDRALAARLVRATLYERAGDSANAESEYNGIVSSDPDSPYAAQAATRIARLHLVKNDTVGAREQMEAIAQAHPHTEAGTAALYAQGDVALVERKTEEARSRYVEAAANRESTMGGPAGTEAAMRLIREAQAIRAEHHDEAMAKLRQAASLAPPGSVTYLLVRESTAITATQQNEYDEAAANYREIIRVAEAASPGAYQGEDWADYGRYGLAETYFSQAKYAEGVKVLEVLMSSERDSPWVRNGAHLCASCYAGTGRIEEGIALLEGTIRRHPHTQSAAAAQIAIGHLRARQGRPDLALQAYQRVLTDYADVAGCEPVRAEAEFNIKDTMAEQKGGQP